jgi:hypothetical protein
LELEVRSHRHIFLAKTAKASGFRNGSDQGAVNRARNRFAGSSGSSGLLSPELMRSAFVKRMLATALIECPCGTPNRKAVVAEQMVLPAAVVGSSSYKKGAFHRLWMELK